jgi:hypothetical protein
MLEGAMIDSTQAIAEIASLRRELEIPGALPVRLQTLDLARHIAIDPQGKRYVVATFDDSRLQRDYITAVYPQQSGYLTLICLVIAEFQSQTPEEAFEQQVAVIKAIQAGRLDSLVKKG